MPASLRQAEGQGNQESSTEDHEGSGHQISWRGTLAPRPSTWWRAGDEAFESNVIGHGRRLIASPETGVANLDTRWLGACLMVLALIRARNGRLIGEPGMDGLRTQRGAPAFLPLYPPWFGCHVSLAHYLMIVSIAWGVIS